MTGSPPSWESQLVCQTVCPGGPDTCTPAPQAQFRPPPRVTDCELTTALHHTQSGKSPGPDGVYAEFLRDGLICKGRAFLRDLIDATIFSGYIPQA